MDDDLSVPIPESYLNNDMIPLVICRCGRRWAIDHEGIRSYAAYSRHYREEHDDDVNDWDNNH